MEILSDSKEIEKNIELLEQKLRSNALVLPKDEMLQWEFCRTGKESSLNLRRKNTEWTLQSDASKEAEIRQWRSSFDLQGVEIVLLYGIGLGNYYESLQEWLAGDKKRKLVVFEDDIDVLVLFCKTSIAASFLTSSQTSLFYLHQSPEILAPQLDRFLEVIFGRKTVSTSLLMYELFKKEIWRRWNYIINYQLSVKNAGAGEYLSKQEAFFSNLYRNLFVLPKAALLEPMREVFKGIPAILCGAGPSLEKNIPLLKQLKEKALIFGGGTSMNALMAHGMAPHLGIGIDPFEYQFSRILSAGVFDVPYIIHLRLNSTSMHAIGGSYLYASGSVVYPVIRWFEEKLGLRTSDIEEGANVVNYSLALAAFLTANPVIAVGVDLAYTEGKSYTSGIKLHALHDPKEHLITKQLQEELIPMKDALGNKIQTLQKWIIEAEWFSYFAKSRQDVKFINCTEGGLPFPAIEHMSLSSAAAHFLNDSYDILGLLRVSIAAQKIPVESKKVHAVLEEYIALLTHTFSLLKEKNFDALLNDLGYQLILKNIDESYLAMHKSKDALAGWTDEERARILIDVLSSNFKYIEEAFREYLMKEHLERQKSVPAFSIPVVDDPLLKEQYVSMPLSNGSGLKEETRGSFTVKTHFKKGVLHGPSTISNEKGALLWSSWFVEGAREGAVFGYYSNGKRYCFEIYKEGEREGISVFFHPDGSLKSLASYRKGALDGEVFIQSEEGILLRKAFFKNGLREGEDWLYSPLGKPIAMGSYENDLPVGVAKEWDAHGHVLRQVEYSAPGQIKSSEQYREGTAIPKRIPFPYLDSVSDKSLMLGDAMQEISSHIEKLLPALADHLSAEVREKTLADLSVLRQELDKLTALGDTLKQASGLGEDVKELVWKSVESQAVMRRLMEEEGFHLEEKLLQLTAEVQKLRSQVNKPKS